MIINEILNGVINADIPTGILELGFGKIDTNYNIQKIVIEKVLIKDMNILSYNTLRIDIEDLIWLETNIEYTLYRIPESLISSSRIIEVVGLVEKIKPLIYDGEFRHRFNNDSNLQLANKVYNSRMGISGLHTNIHLKMVGDDTIAVTNKLGEHILPTDTEITFKITNNDDLSNIEYPQVLNLIKLALLAVKSHLYRTLTLSIDKGALYGGTNLDAIRNIIDKYETAYIDYIELRDTIMGKINLISNKEIMKSLYNPLSF